MASAEAVSFRRVLQRLEGAYAILNILPNDTVGGAIRSVDENGRVTFGVNWDMTTKIRFIQSVTIPNEDEDRAPTSPLQAAISKI